MVRSQNFEIEFKNGLCIPSRRDAGYQEVLERLLAGQSVSQEGNSPSSRIFGQIFWSDYVSMDFRTFV